MEAVTRVQHLAESKIPHVPAQYVQSLHDRPTTQNSSLNIPIINLSTPEDSLRGALHGACREWGAFHVTNHGVPLELLHRMRCLGRSFFEETPMPDKLKYSCDPTSAASEGYGSKMLVSNNDTVLDWRDYFDHHTLPLSRRDPSHWPESPSEYRQTVEEYSNQINALAERILGLISESLGLKRDYFKELVGEFYQNITVSYYPACPQPELTLGLQSHSDMGVITLLIQDDVGGLQVLKDGEWVTVEPLDDAIVVILSDQTQVITNGDYISAIHRAITNANKARLSVATFHDPEKRVKISPASELVSESSPRRYRDIVYGDYISSWYTMGPEGKRNLDALLLNS